MTCPCKDCTKRWVSSTSRCHATCQEYKDWCELNRAQSEDIRKKKARFESAGVVLFSHKRKR